jgi:hypothetical protein
MDDNRDRDVTDIPAAHDWRTAGMLLAAGWMGVAFFYPRLWAYGTAAMLALAFGWFTVKTIFGITSNRRALAFAPLAGAAWLAFFYAAFLVLGMN